MRFILWCHLAHKENILDKIDVFYSDYKIIYCASFFEEIEMLYQENSADGVIVSSDLAGRFPGTTLSEMLDSLSRIGISNVLLIPVTLINMPLEEIREKGLGNDLLERPEVFSEPMVIKFLASEGCNLNCAGCTHFSPLIEKPHLLTAEEVSRTCMQLKKVFRYVRSIEFLGGEPLINLDISGLLEAVRSVFPYTHLAILTNGILIPTLKDNQLAAIRDNKAKVVISRYIPTDDKADQIEQILRDWNISYWISEKIEYFRMQYNTVGDKDAQKNFDECPDHLCHTIRNGKLGGCYYATMGEVANEHFNLSIPYFEALYDIYDPKWTGPTLFWKLNRATKLCSWCNSVVGSPMMPWHRSVRGRELIGEWFYDDIDQSQRELKTLHCAFYGGGAVCRWVLRVWFQRGIRPECIIDRNASESFCELCGIPVISSERISEFDREMIFVISCHDQQSVKTVLAEYDIEAERIFDGRCQEEEYLSQLLSAIRDEE